MSVHALNAYRSTDLNSRCETSSKRDLVIMLYDAAIDAMGVAQQHAARGEKRAVNAATTRALTILSGLRETLDLKNGGAVAAHLDDFYVGAPNAADLADCQDLLSQVREAWAAITPQTVGEVNRRLFVVHS
jgi:flagellar protein FliS